MEAVAAEPKVDEAKPGGDDDEPRGFERSPVTGALFATNIAVFAAQLWLAGDFRSYAVYGIPSAILRRLGANASLWTIADTRIETLVTSCFLHASLFHLTLN